MLCAALPGHAQTSGAARPIGASVGADYRTVTVQGYAAANLASALASAWITSDRALALAAGSVSEFETGHPTSYGELRAALRVGPALPVAITLHAEGGGGAYRGRGTSAYGQASLRASRAVRPGVGVWLAVAAGRASAATGYATAHAVLGTSLRAGPVGASASAAWVRAGSAQYEDLHAVASWAPVMPHWHGMFSPALVQLSGGARAGGAPPGPQQWLEGSLALRLVSSATLVLSHGTTPADPERATPATSFSAIAIQLGMGPASQANDGDALHFLPHSTQVTLSRASADGTHTLTIQLAGAHEVELMGDMTAWRPVQMAPTGHDRWAVRLEMRPGLHRLNLRVDGGGWSTVPSLPQLTDDFGVVSVLVVP